VVEIYSEAKKHKKLQIPSNVCCESFKPSRALPGKYGKKQYINSFWKVFTYALSENVQLKWGIHQQTNVYKTNCNCSLSFTQVAVAHIKPFCWIARRIQTWKTL